MDEVLKVPRCHVIAVDELGNLFLDVIVDGELLSQTCATVFELTGSTILTKVELTVCDDYAGDITATLWSSQKAVILPSLRARLTKKDSDTFLDAVIELYLSSP